MPTVDSEQSTHWPGCHTVHLGCANARANTAAGQRDVCMRQLAQARTEVVHLHERLVIQRQALQQALAYVPAGSHAELAIHAALRQGQPAQPVQVEECPVNEEQLAAVREHVAAAGTHADVLAQDAEALLAEVVRLRQANDRLVAACEAATMPLSWEARFNAETKQILLQLMAAVEQARDPQGDPVFVALAPAALPRS